MLQRKQEKLLPANIFHHKFPSLSFVFWSKLLEFVNGDQSQFNYLKWVWRCAVKLSFLENIFWQSSHWNDFWCDSLCLFRDAVDANIFSQSLQGKSRLPKCLFMCVASLYVLENSLLHVLHKVSFTTTSLPCFSWPQVFRCLLAICSLENFFPHITHGWVSLPSMPVWVFSWSLRLSRLFVAKLQLGKLHWKSFMSPWLLSCLLKSLEFLNLPLHWGQT